MRELDLLSRASKFQRVGCLGEGKGLYAPPPHTTFQVLIIKDIYTIKHTNNKVYPTLIIANSYTQVVYKDQDGAHEKER